MDSLSTPTPERNTVTINLNHEEIRFDRRDETVNAALRTRVHKVALGAANGAHSIS
jgi:hypothetical protein